jgi:hypothetical protein
VSNDDDSGVVIAGVIADLLHNSAWVEGKEGGEKKDKKRKEEKELEW